MSDVPKLTDSKEKLIETMRATIGYQDRHFAIAKAILYVKGQEEAADQTRSLIRATYVLAFVP